MAVVTEHDVVEHLDPEQRAGLAQSIGELDVLGAGRGFAARVVVHEDDGRGRLAQHVPETSPGVIAHAVKLPTATRISAIGRWRTSSASAKKCSRPSSRRRGRSAAATSLLQRIGACLSSGRLLARVPSSSAARRRHALVAPMPGLVLIAASPARCSPASPPTRSSKRCATTPTGSLCVPVPSTIAISSASLSACSPLSINRSRGPLRADSVSRRRRSSLAACCSRRADHDRARIHGLAARLRRRAWRPGVARRR